MTELALLDEPDTCTREHSRRVRGLCEECGGPLKAHQIERGGRFCSPRCSGRNVARREYGPAVVPLHDHDSEQEEPVGIVHELIGDEYDTTTGERNDYPLPDRCEGCGGPYRRKRKDQRYCTPACRSRHHNTARPARTRPPKRLTAVEAAPPVTTVTAGPGVDLATLLGQVLAAAGEWRLEARIGDVQLVLTRPAP